MKNQRWLLLLLVFSLALFVAGCGDDDDPVGGGNEFDFNHLSAAQKDSVAVQMFANSVVSAEATAGNGITSLETGHYGGGGTLIASPKGPVAELASPPEGWLGPNDEGWYSYDVSGNLFLTELSLRWTPDLWADDYDGGPATRIEVHQQLDFANNETNESLTFRTEWWIGTNTPRDLAEGSIATDITATGQGALDFSHSVSWDHVTVALDDYAGNYQTTGSYSFYDPEQGEVIRLQNLFSDFSFVADGSGEGNAGIASVELIRYEFDAVVAGSGERTGRYYLLSENWLIPHEFVIEVG